jgi:hypothetical protein
MQIIWDTTIVEQLRRTQTVLELEAFPVQGALHRAYCVVPAEKIKLNEYALLEAHKELHSAFVSALDQKDYKQCETMIPLLRGQFGGELDSFYDEILKRIHESNTL